MLVMINNNKARPEFAGKKRIVVDEGLGPHSPLFQQLLRILDDHGNRKFLFLKDSHRGIPDIEILTKLLDESTLLLTTDRVLHNRALELGFASWTCDDSGKLTADKRPAIP